MQHLSTLLLSLTTLAPAAWANFDIYFHGGEDALITDDSYDYKFYNNDPSCNTVYDAKTWTSRSDVSDKKYGIRCEFEGNNNACFGDGPMSSITVFEMNFSNDDYHWTIYKDRDYHLYDLDGNDIGTCYPYPNDDYECDFVDWPLGQMIGRRLLRCETDYDADDIDAQHPHADCDEPPCDPAR